MRVGLTIGTLGVALAACSNSDAAQRAAFVAAGISAITPKSLGGGLTMTGAKATGSTLTLSIGGGDPSELAEPSFNRQLTDVICHDSNFRKIIEQGVDLDLDLTDRAGGKARVSVTSC